MNDTSSLHKSLAEKIGPLKFAIVTVSDSRDKSSDVNGSFLRKEIERKGHVLTQYSIVPDDPVALSGILEELSETPVHVILFNGGTGISSRDRTYDVLAGRLEKKIPGFGEIFRFLSFEQIGSAAMISRATAGIFRKKLVFSTPGSPKAVELAWNELIAPELNHLIWELRKKPKKI